MRPCARVVRPLFDSTSYPSYVRPLNLSKLEKLEASVSRRYPRALGRHAGHPVGNRGQPVTTGHSRGGSGLGPGRRGVNGEKEGRVSRPWQRTGNCSRRGWRVAGTTFGPRAFCCQGSAPGLGAGFNPGPTRVRPSFRMPGVTGAANTRPAFLFPRLKTNEKDLAGRGQRTQQPGAAQSTSAAQATRGGRTGPQGRRFLAPGPQRGSQRLAQTDAGLNQYLSDTTAA